MIQQQPLPGGESSETVLEEPQPKKLKLTIRETNLASHFDQLKIVHDENIVLQILSGIQSFYPLSAKDGNLLAARLLAIVGGQEASQLALKSPQVRLGILKCLERAVRQDWAGLVFDFEGMVKTVAEIARIEEDPDVLARLISLICILIGGIPVDSASYSVAIRIGHNFAKSQHCIVRLASIATLTEVALQQLKAKLNENSGGLINPRLRRRLALKSAYANRGLLNSTDKSKYSDPGFKELRLTHLKANSGAVRMMLASVTVPIEKLLAQHVSDADSRVRILAIDCLIRLYENGFPLDQSLYGHLCATLSDESEGVRIRAVRLIWIFANLYPEKQVISVTSCLKVRLVDDAFTKLCSAMQDISAEVRARAAESLGSLTSVTEKFLEQTLDKKLLSHMQAVSLVSGNYRYRGNQNANRYLSNEYSTGRKFGADKPIEKQDEDQKSIMPSGACGAFVTGLEDEFSTVRNASISAVCSLAQDHESFSALALDFLADMFNDEIAEVRLNAIHALRSICRTVKLKEDQMEIILGVLDDFASESREALRDLLSICSMATSKCLHMAVRSLMSNLKRYPSDKLSIWRCMKYLGWNHGALAQALAPELLGHHAYFDIPEQDIENPEYIGSLILVLNATFHCPAIRSFLMEHTWRHYQYLRDGMAELVPSLSVIEDPAELSSEQALANTQTQLVRMIDGQLDKLAGVAGHARTMLMEYILSDLEKLCHIHSDLEGHGRFLMQYLETELKLLKRHRKLVSSVGGFGIQERHLLFEAYRSSLGLQFKFANLTRRHFLLILNQRIKIMCLMLNFKAELWDYFKLVLFEAKQLNDQMASSSSKSSSVKDHHHLPTRQIRGLTTAGNNPSVPGNTVTSSIASVLRNLISERKIYGSNIHIHASSLVDCCFNEELPKSGSSNQNHASIRLSIRPSHMTSSVQDIIGGSHGVSHDPGDVLVQSVENSFAGIKNSNTSSRESPSKADWTITWDRDTLIGRNKEEDEFRSTNLCRRLVEIVEPESSGSATDNVRKFTAGLVASIELVVNCDHCAEILPRLRIKVAYPDSSQRIFKPRKSDFHFVGPGKIQLKTSALLCHSVWTEPSKVELTVVIQLPQEVAVRGDQDQILWLECSEPVKLSVLPKSFG